MRSVAALVCLTTSSAAVAGAQVWDRMTNPSVKVPISHPPQVALANGIKVAVLDFTGNQRCAPDLTVRIAQALQQAHTFEMIDRRSLAPILAGQNSLPWGPVSPQTRARIGQVVGPAALFTGRVMRCTTDLSGKIRTGDTKDKNGVVHTKYIRRAVVALAVQVSVVDVTTGEMHVGNMIDLTDSLVTEATDADPAVPDPDNLRTKQFDVATVEMRRVVLPWDEVVNLVVYDDDKCGLRTSAAQIKRGKLTDAAAGLQTWIAKSCDAPRDNNLMSKALYNFGIALTYADRPEEGLKALEASATQRKSGITDEAIKATRKIIALNEDRRRATEEAMNMGAPVAPPPAPQGALTNKDIIDMAAAKLSDAVIIAKIKSSPCKYDTSTKGLVALKQAGVSDAVVVEMTNAAGRCR